MTSYHKSDVHPMGFNLGSTRIRQVHTGDVQSHVFESPLIRLMKDHGYVDAYHDGQILPQGPVCSRSIWIFRYYDVVDEDFGDGERKEIEFHARKLGDFLLHVRGAVLEQNEDPGHFRAYLVAHSMGGLICRCYLQNPGIPDINGNTGAAKNACTLGVDKVFTYGTPHGGIEFRRGLGWMEGMRDFIDMNNSGNFGPRRMREFLDLPLIDSIVSVRGVPVELNRRTCDEGSAVFRKYGDLKGRSTKLFTAFLLADARINSGRASLGLALQLRVRVPDYEVDGVLWFDDHYEGGTLFSDKLNIEFTPEEDGDGQLHCGWDSQTPNGSPRSVTLAMAESIRTGTIPFSSGDARPGIRGDIQLTITPWNA